MSFRPGDRVRIRHPESEYTGCRGTIVAGPGSNDPHTLPLGFYVAVDGENGVAQPFLSQDLDRVAARAVRSSRAAAENAVGARRA